MRGRDHTLVGASMNALMDVELEGPGLISIKIYYK